MTIINDNGKGTLPTSTQEVKYCFLARDEDNFKQLTSFYKCSDYLLDILAKDKCTPVSYDANTRSKEETLIGIKSYPEKIQTIKDHLTQLNAVEAANHFKRSYIIEIDPSTIVFVGSKLWMGCNFRLSLYLKLIRTPKLYTEYCEVLNETEWKFLKWLMNGKLRLINKGIEHSSGCKAGYYSHGHGGIFFTLRIFFAHRNSNYYNYFEQRLKNLDKLYKEYRNETL